MKYLVQVCNNGVITHENVESELDKKELAEQYYNELLDTLKNDNDLEPDIDMYTDEGEPDGYSIEAEVDYCMGPEYIYDISVRVEEI